MKAILDWVLFPQRMRQCKSPLFSKNSKGSSTMPIGTSKLPRQLSETFTVMKVSIPSLANSSHWASLMHSSMTLWASSAISFLISWLKETSNLRIKPWKEDSRCQAALLRERVQTLKNELWKLKSFALLHSYLRWPVLLSQTRSRLLRAIVTKYCSEHSNRRAVLNRIQWQVVKCLMMMRICPT